MKSDRSELGKTLVLVGEWTLILLLFLAGIYLQQDECRSKGSNVGSYFWSTGCQ